MRAKIKRTYLLPEKMRDELKEPLGELLIKEPTKAFIERVAKLQPPLVVMIGDFCVHKALQEGFVPDIAIIDGLNLREPYEIKPITRAFRLKAKNPPSTITKRAWRAIKKAFKRQLRPKAKKRPVVLVIEGEEDLLVIPAVIEAPLQTIIVYGQPHKGLVLIKVTTNVKLKCKKLIERMKVEK